MHIDKCGNTCRQKCCAKGRGREVNTQKFMYRDTMNVGDYTSNNWSHRNSNKLLRKNLEVISGKHSTDSLHNRAVLRTSHII